jgi:hypothetical protein
MGVSIRINLDASFTTRAFHVNEQTMVCKLKKDGRDPINSLFNALENEARQVGFSNSRENRYRSERLK